MKARCLSVPLGLVTFTLLLLVARMSESRAADGPPATQPGANAADFLVTGPDAHDNLSVFILHGPDRLNGRQYLTLQEALEQKVVIVRETGNVNELVIENVSTDKDVFVQSGDIVKGGRQDRTIAQDFIAPPKSGAMPLDAFCVEHGRWSRRGGEDASAFASSGYSIGGKGLKLAAKRSKNQSEVWEEVSKNQQRLASNAGESVTDARSASSYQLTLENKKVQETTDAYVKALEKVIDGQPDAIGYAFAINGKVNSAEAYGSHALFVKLWPKLLRSSAVEAFAELKKDSKYAPVTAAAVIAAIDDVTKGKTESQDLTARVRQVTKETSGNVLYETQDRAGPATAPSAEAAYVHRSYLSKDEASAPANHAVHRQGRGINAPAANPQNYQQNNGPNKQ